MSAKIIGAMSFSDAAYKVLKSSKTPLKPTKIAEIAIEKGLTTGV